MLPAFPQLGSCLPLSLIPSSMSNSRHVGVLVWKVVLKRQCTARAPDEAACIVVAAVGCGMMWDDLKCGCWICNGLYHGRHGDKP